MNVNDLSYTRAETPPPQFSGCDTSTCNCQCHKDNGRTRNEEKPPCYTCSVLSHVPVHQGVLRGCVASVSSTENRGLWRRAAEVSSGHPSPQRSRMFNDSPRGNGRIFLNIPSLYDHLLPSSSIRNYSDCLRQTHSNQGEEERAQRRTIPTTQNTPPRNVNNYPSRTPRCQHRFPLEVPTIIDMSRHNNSRQTSGQRLTQNIFHSKKGVSYHKVKIYLAKFALICVVASSLSVLVVRIAMYFFEEY